MHNLITLDATQMPEWSEIMVMFETAVKLLGIGAVIVAAIVWIIKTVKALRAPQKSLEERVGACESHLDNDNRRFRHQAEVNEDQAQVNRLLLKSNLAMQSHILDGNHTKELAECRKDINEYLMSR